MAGLWSKSGVPHKGWECVGVTDTRAEELPGEEAIYAQCEMCENYPVRYVHHMKHDGYPNVLDVGCICASKMEFDYAAASRREEKMKRRAGLRSRWLKRVWKESRNGNPYLKDGMYLVGVNAKKGSWGWWIIRKQHFVENERKMIEEVAEEKRFSDKRYDSEARAKLAVFDALQDWKAGR